MDETQHPHADDMVILSNDMPFMTFVTVGTHFINVLEIQDAPIAFDEYYHFGMTVFLDTADHGFVDVHSQSIMTQILYLYSVARPIPTTHITWLQESYIDPNDLVLPTETVIVVHWEQTHPFFITQASDANSATWRGPDPDEFTVSYDNIANTTTFTLPKNYITPVFYYCWFHEAMGVHPISMFNRPALADDMQITETWFSVLLHPTGPVALRVRGIYAREQDFNFTVFLATPPPDVTSNEPETPDEPEEMLYPVLVFTPQDLPALADTSLCPDVVNVMRGSRLMDRPNTVLMQSNLNSAETACTLSHAYLDVEVVRRPKDSTESAYAKYLTHLQETGTYQLVDELWTLAANALPLYGPNAQLAVLSCDDTASSETILDDYTDFSFILDEAAIGVNVTTMRCMGAFCMVAISTTNCIFTYHVQFVSPLVAQNILLPAVLIEHAIVSSTFAVREAHMHNTDISGITMLNGFRVFYAQQVTMSFLCVDLHNTPCSDARGHDVMRVLTSTRALQSIQMNSLSESKTVVVTDMLQTSETAAGTLFTASQKYFTMIGISETVQKYLHGNMKCPEHMVSTGSTDTFRYAGASAKILCKFCGMNTYYNRVESAPILSVNAIRRMYIQKQVHEQLHPVAPEHSTPHGETTMMHRRRLLSLHSYQMRASSGTNANDPVNDDAYPTAPSVEYESSNEANTPPHNSMYNDYTQNDASHGAGQHGTVVSYFLTDVEAHDTSTGHQMHGEECVVDIDTMLTLTLPNANMTYLCLHLFCEDVDLHVDIVDVNSISFHVTSEYAGKAIFVVVMDSSKDTHAGADNHAVFFPRAVQTEGECIECPIGKFGGSIGQSDISACKDSGVSAFEDTDLAPTQPDQLTPPDLIDTNVIDPMPLAQSRRSLDVAEIDETNDADLTHDGADPAHNDADLTHTVATTVSPYMTYFELDGQIVIVYEIDHGHRHDQASDFGIVAILGNCNISHITAHIVGVQTEIVRLLHAGSHASMNVTYIFTRTNTTNVIGANTPDIVILEIEGNYVIANKTNNTDHDAHPSESPTESEPALPSNTSNSTVPPSTANATSTPKPAVPTSTPAPESPFVVTMAVSLPFTLAEFDDSKQLEFKGVIANVAGVNLKDVAISGIVSVATNAQRRLLASTLRVDMRINAASTAAASRMGATLSNPTTLNTALSSAGLPAATVLVAPATVQTSSNSNTPVLPVVQRSIIENTRNPVLIGAVVGGVVLLILLIVISNSMPSKKKASSHPMFAGHVSFAQLQQGVSLPEFAGSHRAPTASTPQGRYYPIRDQSGAISWHAG